MFGIAASWKIIAGMGVAILILGGTVWGVWQAKKAAETELARVEGELEQAVQVNKDNEVVVEKLKRQQEADRRLTAVEIEDAKKRNTTIITIKKDQRHAPDAADELTPYDHDFFDRLRQSRNPG